MQIIQWIISPGTNSYVLDFLDNNSVLIIGLWGILLMYLRYRAKKTPSPEDDELVEQIDNQVKSWFQTAIGKRTNRI